MEATPKKPAAAKKPAVKKATTAKKPAAKKTATKATAKEAVEPEVIATPEITQEEVKIETPIFVPVAGKNFYAVGRRKTSVAQVIITAGKAEYTVNKGAFEKHFPTPELRHIATNAMSAIGLEKYLNFKAKVSGGGIHSQAEALRHGITRALILMNPESRRTLKKLGFLTRDPRVKERKKPGLHRARRAPQFSKR